MVREVAGRLSYAVMGFEEEEDEASLSAEGHCRPSPSDCRHLSLQEESTSNNTNAERNGNEGYGAAELEGDHDVGVPRYEEFREWLRTPYGASRNAGGSQKKQKIMEDETYGRVQRFLKAAATSDLAVEEDAKFREMVRRSMYHLVTARTLGLVDVVFTLNDLGQPRRLAPMSEIPHALHQAHVVQTRHGNIRKTSRVLAEQFVGIPEEVVSRFVYKCPNCIITPPATLVLPLSSPSLGAPSLSSPALPED